MAIVKFFRFWRLTPYTPLVQQSSMAFITTLSLVPIIFFALVTFITKSKMFKQFTPILGLVVYLTMVHMVTVASVRYRYPLEPLLIVIAAPSITIIWNLILGKVMPGRVLKKS